MNPREFSRKHLFLAFAAYLAFVVYGSLIPFRYKPHTFAEALGKFAQIGYLNLGVTSRADWVANIVLYVPLAFLGCAWLGGMSRTPVSKRSIVAMVLALCLVTATAVEFTQIFFSPRTVSLNDLLAETIGTILGLTAWSLGRQHLAALWDAFSRGGKASVIAAGVAYVAAYLALSLFPFDFVVSAKELAWKLHSGNQSLFIVSGCGGVLRCGARLTAEMLAVAPLGVLLSLAAPRLRLPMVFMLGAGLGLVLESVQFLLASGTSQGASVLLRGVGLTAGAAVGQMLQRKGPVLVARRVWRSVPLATLPYIVAVLGVSGWFSTRWLPPSEAFRRIADVHFLPFFYHYFSTESAAMASLLANVAMYAPVGLAVWAWQTVDGRDTRRGALLAALAGLCLAAPVEFGKLLVPPKHPDPTNLLIAAGGALFARALAAWFGRVIAESRPDGFVPQPVR